MTAILRALVALREAGITVTTRPVRAPNSLNEVWFVDGYVLRVDPRLGRERLAHERTVLEALPAGVPHPEVLGYGQTEFGEWLLLRRVKGRELSRQWLAMTNSQRAGAIGSLGQALRTLHALEAMPAPGADLADAPHTLPAARLLRALEQAMQLRFVDQGILRAGISMVTDAAEALDRDPRHLVHGDLHLENVLWDGTKLTAIVDFEWAQAGPPDLDLDVLFHSLAAPELHVAPDYDRVPQRWDFDGVASWLRASYPALFAHPRLVERLVVYRVAYETAALLRQPPDRPLESLDRFHPWWRLCRVVEGRSDLSWAVAS